MNINSITASYRCVIKDKANYAVAIAGHLIKVGGAEKLLTPTALQAAMIDHGLAPLLMDRHDLILWKVHAVPRIVKSRENIPADSFRCEVCDGTPD